MNSALTRDFPDIFHKPKAQSLMLSMLNSDSPYLAESIIEITTTQPPA